MKIEQAMWTETGGWQSDTAFSLGKKAQLVLVFGSFDILKRKDHYDFIRDSYPEAGILGCSTSGEITGTRVFDGTVVLTAVSFNSTHVEHFSTQIQGKSGSYSAGLKLAEKFPKKDLSHLFVLSDGLNINGSKLVEGLADALPSGVNVTGGLAGDQAKFEKTLVITETGPSESAVSAVGFYGGKIKVGYGSKGGWSPFGLDRTITRSKDNILYELDGRPALSLYKKYLGDQAKDLPASGLLFPLRIMEQDGRSSLVRTILGVNEKKGSMIFAGDMPEGRTVRLMKANIERLVTGAGVAAERALDKMGPVAPELAILVSCVGRKLVLKQRVEEEVESVQETVGSDVFLTGFYSYGEICPCTIGKEICELHNQTMTITTLSEET